MNDFQPLFMKKISDFRLERKLVKSESDWLIFRQKWLDTSTWPRWEKDDLALKFEQWTNETGGKGYLTLADTKWGRSELVYALTPEARFEYSFTKFVIGGAICLGQTPPLQWKDVPSTWTSECPRCEIFSSSFMPKTCPKCGGQLVAFPVND